MELHLRWIKLKKEIKRISKELEDNLQIIHSAIEKENEETEVIKRRSNKLRDSSNLQK